jgi:hypothetical protein
VSPSRPVGGKTVRFDPKDSIYRYPGGDSPSPEHGSEVDGATGSEEDSSPPSWVYSRGDPTQSLSTGGLVNLPSARSSAGSNSRAIKRGGNPQIAPCSAQAKYTMGHIQASDTRSHSRAYIMWECPIHHSQPSTTHIHRTCPPRLAPLANHNRPSRTAYSGRRLHQDLSPHERAVERY